MGLFDGQIKSFAVKFCNYLDNRVQEKITEGREATDKNVQASNFMVALVLIEVSNALKATAEL